MKYVSTRGAMQETSFMQVLLMGLAPDGGLAVPVSWPYFDAKKLSQWANLSYADLAFAIMRHFIAEEEIPDEDLQNLLHQVYAQENFTDPEITPIQHVYENIYLLGLSNGPTLAFKDVAMQFLGAVFEYVLTKKNTSINILAATSGDTGSAAEYAMIGKKNVNVFMLSPYQRMSPFQQAQMYSLYEPNIFNIAVRGVFDDCQDLVKALNHDGTFKEQYRLGAVNSINWARILAQTVYYFKAWLALDLLSGQEVDFCVPSGNFGNVLAGYYAKKMGLPIRHLIVATNENDVLHEFFCNGVYQVRKSADIRSTSSPSMDIGKASNFERFIYDVLGENSAAIAQFNQCVEQMSAFKTADIADLTDAVLASGFLSGSSTHVDRLEIIRRMYHDYGVMVDPHTADGLKVAETLREERLGKEIPLICLETAQPAKFAATIKEALGILPPRPQRYEGIEDAKMHFSVLDKSVDDLKTFIQMALD